MNNRNPIRFHRLSIPLALCLAVCLSPADLFSQDQGDTHAVRTGETLFSIARQHDITVGELREWNRLGSDNLRSGMILMIARPEQQDEVRHTVAAGETLYSISRMYDVTIPEIQQWNHLDGTVLSSGQVLTIYSGKDAVPEVLPEPDSPPAGSNRESIVSSPTAANTYYVVRSGDYLNRIAREHGMTADELRRLNNLENDTIAVGRRLIVHSSQNTPVVEEGLQESTPQGRFINYTTAAGEGADDLLEHFSMTPEELEALNPGTDIRSLGGGQRVTVLLPANRNFRNPYRKQAGLRDLGSIAVSKYDERSEVSTTTSGELYNPSQLTAGHASIALGSIVFVENTTNGRGIYVKINDRFSGNGIRLSEKAFETLGLPPAGGATAVVYQEN